MDWLNSLFITHSATQTVVVLSLICTWTALGKVCPWRVARHRLRFFIGIVAGHFGLQVDAQMLDYAETFGLSLFVYTLGLYVGPNSSVRYAMRASRSIWSLAVIVLGMALMLCRFTSVSLPDMIGILCGATTNTPALGAAQQALVQMGQPTSGAVWVAPSPIRWEWWA